MLVESLMDLLEPEEAVRPMEAIGSGDGDGDRGFMLPKLGRRFVTEPGTASPGCGSVTKTSRPSGRSSERDRLTDEAVDGAEAVMRVSET